jgi:hypothetical protein
MRKEIRPGLQIEDFFNDRGSATGYVIVPASRNDLKFWVDSQDLFSHYIHAENEFRARHILCSTGTLAINYNIDRPKTKIVCNSCLKGWEVHQLEQMPPKSFSSIFEYRINAHGPWPDVLVVKSNGVIKYTTAQPSLNEIAAEYFLKAFEHLRKNGFRKKKQ